MAMDEAQPVLELSRNTEINFASRPDRNEVMDGISIAAITISSAAILLSVFTWGTVLKQLKGKSEAVLVIIGFGSFIGFSYCLFQISHFEIGFTYWVYIAGLLYISGIALVKVAILMQWMRTLSSRSHSAFFWLCQVQIWLNVAFYVAAIITESMQCTPRESIWDSTVKGRCLPIKALEVIPSINVVSDVTMLVAPQFIIWRLKPRIGNTAGVLVMIIVGLFGSISAVFRLVGTVKYLKSEDTTYTVTPVCSWALAEMTSIFVVYGLPAVPTLFFGTASRLSQYYTRFTQGSSTARTGDTPNISNIGPWREGRAGPSKSYRNLEKRNSLPDNVLNTATTHCASTRTDPAPPRPPESSCVVMKTVEIRRDEIRTDELSDMEKDIGEDVRLRQHPWAKKIG